MRISKIKVFIAILAMSGVPILSSADFKHHVSDCLVPVYHTNFAFPPEGGRIVKIGHQMYFVQDYRPECAHVAHNAPVVPTPGVHVPKPSPAPPVYTAPPTGAMPTNPTTCY